MNAETIAGKLRHFASRAIQFVGDDLTPGRKAARQIAYEADLLTDEIIRGENPEIDRLNGILREVHDDLKKARDRAGAWARAYQLALVGEENSREQNCKRAYYKGRCVGKKIERAKREKMLDGLIESRKIWQDRAETAEGQVKQYKEAAMTHGIMDFDAYIKEYQGALDNITRLSNPDVCQLRAFASRLGYVALRREDLESDLRDYDEMERKLAAATRLNPQAECTTKVTRSYSRKLYIYGVWHFVEVHHNEETREIVWYVDGTKHPSGEWTLQERGK